MTSRPAQMVQFVWFVVDTSNLNAENLFRVLLDVDPTLSQNNKVPSAAMPFLSSAKLVDENVAITLNVTQGRVDLFFTPSEEGQVPHGGIPVIDARAVIDSATEKFNVADFGALGGIYRLAVVVNYSERLPDRSSGGRDFFSFLGIDPGDNAGEVSDLLFRANRRKGLGAASVVANRLLQLSVETIQKVEFRAQSFRQIDFQDGARNELFYLTRAVDVNSVVDNVEFFATDSVRDTIGAFCTESLRLAAIHNIAEV